MQVATTISLIPNTEMAMSLLCSKTHNGFGFQPIVGFGTLLRFGINGFGG